MWEIEGVTASERQVSCSATRTAGQEGRRRAEDTAVGMQLLIRAQIGLLVFNKGAKFPFKNPAGIWVQRFSHNREEHQV